jgi:type II secretory pathway component GspD/PulD (secretin)
VAESRKQEEVRIQHHVVVDWRSAFFGFSFLDVDVRSVVSDLSGSPSRFVIWDQLMNTGCVTGKTATPSTYRLLVTHFTVFPDSLQNGSQDGLNHLARQDRTQ